MFPGAEAKASAASKAESPRSKTRAGHKPTSGAWLAWCSTVAVIFGYLRMKRPAGTARQGLAQTVAGLRRFADVI